MQQHVALIKELWPLAAGLGAGVGWWLKLRAEVRKFNADRARQLAIDLAAEAERRRAQEAALITIAQEAAKDVIQGLREEVERLRKEVAELERELSEARKDHAESIAAKDAKIALLEGQLRQALALAQSYEQKLTDAGIPHERPVQPFWGVDAGVAPVGLVEGRLP